jgi:hypothetical protein
MGDVAITALSEDGCLLLLTVPSCCLPARLTGLTVRFTRLGFMDRRAHLNRYVLQRIYVHMWSSGICGVYGQGAQ